MTKCILNCLKILSPKRHNRGKTQWTIKSFILQSSHIMILNSTKFGGNRTKDVEVGPDRRTDRQADSYISPQTMFAGGIIIDESLILAIVLRNYSTKPNYIFQLKRELKVWKYTFNLFHFEMLIQNRNPKFRPLCLFGLTFHEYKVRFVFGFRLDYKLSLFIFFFLLVSSCFVYYLCVIINIS